MTGTPSVCTCILKQPLWRGLFPLVLSAPPGLSPLDLQGRSQPYPDLPRRHECTLCRTFATGLTPTTQKAEASEVPLLYLSRVGDVCALQLLWHFRCVLSFLWVHSGCVDFAATAIPPPSQLGALDKNMAHPDTCLSCVPSNNRLLSRWRLPEVRGWE